ncbi:hypothetical protein HK405_003555, partial [Cladochytrium tenue]
MVPVAVAAASRALVPRHAATAAVALRRPAALVVQARHFQQKKAPPPLKWGRVMLFQTVLNLVFDYAHVPHEKV